MSKTLYVLFFLLCVCISYAQNRYEYEHRQMGTQIRLVFYAMHKEKADSVSSAVFTRIDELNHRLSDYIENSELNALCKQAQQNVVVSDDVYAILQEAVYVSGQTSGTFDSSAGPLIQLWREARKTKNLPCRTKLIAAKRKVDYRYITFPDKNTIYLEKAGMQLDLGGIGKGFAADEALKIMESFGIISALIDMGGDIRVSDPPPDKAFWTVAFSYFDEAGKEIIQRIQIKNQAVATSGDLYQFADIDGVRYSHIINPKTGMALNSGIQVTTIARNATLADAYASAMSVMGIDRTKVLLTKIPDLEVFMVGHSQKDYRQWNSPKFYRFLVKD